MATASEVPLPMDDDTELEGIEKQPLEPLTAAPAPESSGYGPVRRKDEKVEADGIVFQPAEVEDVVMETLEDKGISDDEGEAPYTKPDFPAVSLKDQGLRRQMRRVAVPPNRLTPLKASWVKLIQPCIEHMFLEVRMNTRRRAVEIRNSDKTEDIAALQKAADYFKAFMLGFDQTDAVALLRLEDLFIESFEVKDVKRLQGDHLSRCIGRIAGKDGKTKYAIENSTRTRISLCEDKIHILGSFSNIKLARDAICSLILGSEPGKVYTRLRTVSKRLQERI